MLTTYPARVPLWARPLSCLLGRHAWHKHPNSFTAPSGGKVEGRYCLRCHREEWRA